MFLSPVKHIPGPFISRISSIPLKIATWRAQRTPYAHALIEQYGHIVVIAPEQVLTDDDTAMKTIYDRSSIKTSFYSRMGSWKGVVSTLGKLDYASAAPTRNNLIACFQNKNLALLAEHVNAHVKQFVEIMETLAEGGEDIDGVVWFRLLALDVVTDVLWGEKINLLGHANTSTPDFLRRFHAFSRYNATKSFLPGLDTLVKYFGTRKWKTLRNDCSDMDVTAREALDRWNSQDTKRHDRDVLSMLKSMEANDDPKHHLSNDEIPSYMVEMMYLRLNRYKMLNKLTLNSSRAAGSSTTSHTAVFACWALTNNPEKQKKLRHELFAAFKDAKNLDMKASQDLPYLDSVIRETMRMWPMIPGPLERYLGNPITVGNKTVPAGVIASTSAYTQGRKQDVFPNPGEWNPDRWLDATERMRLNWIPFGYGSRACPGSNLAMTELKYMLGALFRSLRAVQPTSHAREEIELQDVFAAGTKSGHCWLKFEKDALTP